MAREIEVQSQVETSLRLRKWYLIASCLTLSIIRYGSRVSVAAIQGKEKGPPLHLGEVTIKKGAFGSPSTTVGQHICVCVFISMA